MNFGWPYPKRKSHLDALVASPSDHTQLVPFQGQNMHLKIYSISTDLPKYRLNNGRTYAVQAEYLATHPELPIDLFTKDLELDEAQRIQHILLKDMIGDKNLLEVLKRDKQSESLILSHEGFVINGNRRLCAMRELFALDPDKYNHFEHINVVVLPPAEEKDIDQLEATLQVKQDIKADYSWYALALMFKKRRDEHKSSVEYLARLYEKGKSEIEELIEMLNIAETYLADRGEQGQYHKLGQTFHAFKEFRKARSKCFKNEPERDCYQKLAFNLIDEGSSDGRLYDVIPLAAKYFDKVIEKVREEFDLVPTPMLVAGGEASLFGEDQVLLGDIYEALSDNSKTEIITKIVTDVVEGEKRKTIELGKANYVLIQVKKANTALMEASHVIGEHQEKAGVDSQIKSIEDSLSIIKAWLNGTR